MYRVKNEALTVIIAKLFPTRHELLPAEITTPQSCRSLKEGVPHSYAASLMETLHHQAANCGRRGDHSAVMAAALAACCAHWRFPRRPYTPTVFLNSSRRMRLRSDTVAPYHSGKPWSKQDIIRHHRIPFGWAAGAFIGINLIFYSVSVRKHSTYPERFPPTACWHICP